MNIVGNGNFTLNDNEKTEKIKKVESIIENLLDTLGFNWNEDPNLMETPKRISKMYVNELLSGCYSQPPNITTFPNTKRYDQMVVSGPIEIKSLCSHHWLPFIGVCYIAYIPDETIIGISKFSRIVNFFMRRPQIQEELTQQICEYIEELLHPKGLIVIIKAQHMCMSVRGVQESDSWMFSSSVKGAFSKNPETRKEFFDLINIKGV